MVTRKGELFLPFGFGFFGFAVVFGCDGGMDAAAHEELAGHLHPPRLAGGHQVVQNLVDHRLVERPLIPVRPQIQLERLQLDTLVIGHVMDFDMGEIRLAGARTQAGELRALHIDLVIPVRVRVEEHFQLFRCLFFHNLWVFRFLLKFFRFPALLFRFEVLYMVLLLALSTGEC